MNTERQRLFLYYRGELVELLKTATVYGTEYYEIRLTNRTIKTVPAKDCTKTKPKTKEERQ